MNRESPFFHYCYDWDGLDIDENSAEFAACTCTFEHEGAAEIRAAIDAKCVCCGAPYSTEPEPNP